MGNTIFTLCAYNFVPIPIIPHLVKTRKRRLARPSTATKQPVQNVLILTILPLQVSSYLYPSFRASERPFTSLQTGGHTVSSQKIGTTREMAVR